MTNSPIYTLEFSQISIADIPRVGGKNASLGELFCQLRPLGVGVIDGFATTADAYRRLLLEHDLEYRVNSLLQDFDIEDVTELAKRGHAVRTAILETPLPEELRNAISNGYERLCKRLGREPELAVRSSATAEDLPGASFAGQQETFLNVRGREGLLSAVHQCFASLFTDRAIVYRTQHGFSHVDVALSVGVMPMVRSDMACAGVVFTLDPESGFRNVVVVSSSFGLGEMVVQGIVSPDEWTVFKPTLKTAKNPIIGRQLGTKEVRLIYAGGSRGTRSEPTPAADRGRLSLSDQEVLTLARWSCLIEEHYSNLAGQNQPMDIEWAKDGITNELFILQARPETVHSGRSLTAVAESFRLTGEHGAPLVTGHAVGEKIGTGRARVVREASGLAAVKNGDVLVAENTDPDWEPVMKRVAAIVTDHGGRTAHAAIVSRELGIPCVVGTSNATTVLKTGEEVTVCCAEGETGNVYAGLVSFEVERIDASSVPATNTAVMLNVGDPAQAFKLSSLPCAGVGLARMEFIITNHIGIHPMALANYPRLNSPAAVVEIGRRLEGKDPREFFIDRLSEGIARIAAAFFPKPVIVRTSDFKTNEYAQLLGGEEFEPDEENPMLGFRGASRYYDDRYREGFRLECEALKRVREDMGLTNLKIMIPFCRTVHEGELVIKTMAANGLSQGENGLEVYAMCELPSNVLRATDFLKVFDGYSIGSNDLTQLVLGLDRDSGTVAHLFNERDEAVRDMIAMAIEAAHNAGKPIGICGQAPSDFPDFATWLVERGITSISLNPDTVIKTTRLIAAAEEKTLDRVLYVT